MKILKALSKDITNNKDIYGFDIETYQEPEDNYIKNKFLMGSVVGDNISKTFWDKKEMADFLISNRNLRNSIIFASNLQFDFFGLFDDYDKFRYLEHKGKLLKCEYIVDSRHKYEFRDTLNYISTSVEKLGNMLNIPKLKHPSFLGNKPKDQHERDILTKYNLQDSFITYNAGLYIKRFCNQIKCKYKTTLASIGLDYWRRNSLNQDIFQEPRSVIDKHYEGSIKGGRTETIKRGYFENIYYYDYNSMYPSVCYNGIDNKGSYPLPSSVKYNHNPEISHIYEEGISKVTIEAPYQYIPYLAFRDNSKLLFPTGTFTGWYTNYELRMALKQGYNIISIHDTVFYNKTFQPFREAVVNLFKLRQQYKKENNEIMSQMVKTIMNAGLFGKFAQQIKHQSNIHTIKSVFVDRNGDIYIKRNNKRHYIDKHIRRGNFIFESIEIPLRIPIYIMPILSSYTTAIARTKLHKDLIKYPNDTIYCDTDSIITKNDKFYNSSNLGMLKLEHKIDEAIFCKPKHYYYSIDADEQYRIKGIPKKFSSKHEFIRESFDKKNIDYTKFIRFKESLVRKIPFNSIININKNINIEDNKRAWDNKFDYSMQQDSRPLDINIEI